MNNVNFLQIGTRNFLLPLGRVLIVDLALANVLQALPSFTSVFMHALTFSILLGISVSAYEIMLGYNIQKKARDKNAYLKKYHRGYHLYFILE